jgi:tetratricopeptide (TPR) repeat protein
MSRPGTRGKVVPRKLRVATWLGASALVGLGCVDFTVAAGQPDWLRHLGPTALGVACVALGAWGARGSALALRIGALVCAVDGALAIAAALGALAPGELSLRQLPRQLPVLASVARLVIVLVLVKTAGVLVAAGQPPPRTWRWPARWAVMALCTVLLAAGVLAWRARRIERQVTAALACLARGEVACARHALAPIAGSVDDEPILQVAAAGVAVAGRRLDVAQGLLGATSGRGFGKDQRLRAEWDLAMGDLLAAREHFREALGKYAEAATWPGAADHAWARRARLRTQARRELNALLLAMREELTGVAAGRQPDRPRLQEEIFARLLDDVAVGDLLRAAMRGLSSDLAIRTAMPRVIMDQMAMLAARAPRPPGPAPDALTRARLALSGPEEAQRAYKQALEIYRYRQNDLRQQLARAREVAEDAEVEVRASQAALERALDQLGIARPPAPGPRAPVEVEAQSQPGAPPSQAMPSGTAL